MAWMKRESAYERRIRELEEEAERVRKNMQRLMKAVPRDTTSYSGEERSSFGGPRKPAFRSTTDLREPPPMDTAVEPSAPVALRPVQVSRQEKIANYLASGSFGKGGSLSKERRIQRNKAIVTLILALLALYSLYHWMK